MTKFHAVEWDDASDPDGNVQHVARHGVTPDEVEEVLNSRGGKDDWSRSSNLPARFGWTSTGKHLIVVYKVKQGRTLTVIRPVTAYEVDP